MPVLTTIPDQRVPLMEKGGNVVSRHWYYFLNEIYTKTGIGRSFLSWTVGVSGAYSPDNNVRHIICDGAAVIILQPPKSREGELIVTNASTKTISFIGSINGDIFKKIRYQNTSIRLRPTAVEYKIV